METCYLGEHTVLSFARPLILWAGLLIVVVTLLTPVPTAVAGRNVAQQPRVPPEQQAEAYAAGVPKNVIELQQFRRMQSIAIKGVDGKSGKATLINLHPAINVGYLLQIDWEGEAEGAYHLENRHPRRQRLVLDAGQPQGLIITDGKQRAVCDLWTAAARRRLDAARQSRLAYAPVCGDKLYLRNRVKGHRTTLEGATDFLRDNVWGGEKLVGLVRGVFYKDAYLNRAVGKPLTGERSLQPAADAPQPALLVPGADKRAVETAQLGIQTRQPVKNGAIPGRWYRAQDNAGIYISMLQPNIIAPQIMQRHTSVAQPLDRVEATALVYLVAFDLGQFDLGFALGTEHPRVEWSARVRAQNVRNDDLPGPDGIGDIAPLVATGTINPQLRAKTVATFTAGFKRSHGAFRYGDLAAANSGSHYGFIEHGMVFSKLQPGLATLFVLDDGSVHMKTWRKSDDQQLARIKHARQNGVAIVEFDAATQRPVAGPLVGRWGQGNWSGSADKKLRSLRAGACIQESRAGRFLIYGYFSSATPSAMARAFQAYNCRYAMHLDMNALEHTYLAVYRRQGTEFTVQHLIQGMNVLDKSEGTQEVPRFVGYADNRDFFYVMRREQRKLAP